MTSLIVAAQLAASAPTVAEVRTLPPVEAGKRVLAGREHSDVAAVSHVSAWGAAPGTVQLDLVEAGRAEDGGCVRRRWRATFRHGAGEKPGDARFTEAFPIDEVALPGRRGCVGSAYAHVNPGVPRDQAIEALSTLARVVRVPDRVEVVCTSGIDPGLCHSRHMTLSMIAGAPVWGVLGSPGALRLMISEGGRLPIEVRFQGGGPGRLPERMIVGKEVPPPF